MARTRGFAAVLGMLLLTMGTAGSARADGAQGDELKARKLFGSGNYKSALDIYTDLYARKPHPTYMRNIGRCYQNLGEPERAISAFREYLRTAKDLTPEARTEVEGFIKEMEDLERSRAPAPARVASPTEARGAAAGERAIVRREPAHAAVGAARARIRLDPGSLVVLDGRRSRSRRRGGGHRHRVVLRRYADEGERPRPHAGAVLG